MSHQTELPCIPDTPSAQPPPAVKVAAGQTWTSRGRTLKVLAIVDHRSGFGDPESGARCMVVETGRTVVVLLRRMVPPLYVLVKETP